MQSKHNIYTKAETNSTNIRYSLVKKYSYSLRNICYSLNHSISMVKYSLIG